MRTYIKTLRWIPVAAYAGFIFYMSSRPWPVPTDLPLYTDKLIHALIYAALGFGLVWAFRATRLRCSSHLLWIAALVGTLYGVTDEIHQHFVPGRTPSIADVLADGAGSFVGAWTGLVAARLLRREHAV